MSERDSDFGAFLAGFFIGGMIGAAVALLLAPQSGEDTRTLIREKSIELKDKATETADEALQRAEKTLEEARTRAETAYQEAMHRAEEFAQMTKDRATSLQERGTVVLEEQKSRLEGAIEAGKKAAQRKRDELSSSTSEDTLGNNSVEA